MRYSVYVSGKSLLAYYSPEMTGFYNSFREVQLLHATIALPEMTGFYNREKPSSLSFFTIALPEMTGFYNDIVFSSLVSKNYSPAGNDRVL